MVSQLALLDAWIPSLLILILLIVAWLLGKLSARRVGTRPGSELSKLTDVFLMLLSLLLAFSFATAYGRYQERRELVVAQANDIGTFYIRTELLPEPARTRVQQLVRQYMELFLQIGHLRGREHLESLDARAEQIQNAIIAEVMEYARSSDKPPLAASVVAAMNTMLDAYESRVAGGLNRGPVAVLLLLGLVAVTSAFLIGRSHTLEGKHHAFSTMMLFALVAAIIYVTLDFDQPTSGLSQTSQLPMHRLAESMGVEISAGERE